VGANVFPVDENTTGVAVANQFTGDIDVWHVREKDVVGSFSQSLGDQCEAPIDLLLVASGTRGALACQSQMPTTDSMLLIENLAQQRPPTP